MKLVKFIYFSTITFLCESEMRFYLQFIVIALLATAACAAKLGNDEPVAIVSSNSEVNADGSYTFASV